MERRTFLALLAGLLVARKFPVTPPDSALVWDGPMPQPMTVYARFVESFPIPIIGAPLTPDVWDVPLYWEVAPSDSITITTTP